MMQSTFRLRQCLHFLSPGNISHFIFSFLHSRPNILLASIFGIIEQRHLQAFGFLPGPEPTLRPGGNLTASRLGSFAASLSLWLEVDACRTTPDFPSFSVDDVDFIFVVVVIVVDEGVSQQLNNQWEIGKSPELFNGPDERHGLSYLRYLTNSLRLQQLSIRMRNGERVGDRGACPVLRAHGFRFPSDLHIKATWSIQLCARS